MKVKPFWDHDCNQCKFVGQISFLFKGEWKQCDLYFCPTPPNRDIEYTDGASIIARFSSEPSDYMSYPILNLSRERLRHKETHWSDCSGGVLNPSDYMFCAGNTSRAIKDIILTSMFNGFGHEEK